MVSIELVSVVLGGAISGGVGIGVAEFRYWRDRKRREKQWAAQLDTLLAMFEEPWTHREYETSSDRIRETDKAVMYDRARNTSTEFRLHVQHAPFGVDAAVIESCSKIVKQCELISMRWDDWTDAVNNESDFPDAYETLVGYVRSLRNDELFE